MDKQFLNHYNTELQHIRESAAEFALDNPKIAGRLSLDRFSCADPYVERLLEGFAYLSARVHHKLDQQFPRFTQSLLNTIFPHFSLPTPSLSIVQFQPDFAEDDLAGGMKVSRNTQIRSRLSQSEKNSCRFSTAHDVELWPLEIVDVDYVSQGIRCRPEDPSQGRGHLRIKLLNHAGNCNELPLDRLTFFLQGANEELIMQLYEQIFANCTAVMVKTDDEMNDYCQLGTDTLKPVGFSDDEALLPYDSRSFQGYRLLAEYFTLPERFMFFEVDGLRTAITQCEGNTFELILVFDAVDFELERNLGKDNLALYCSPVINLFSKRTDRVHLSKKTSEIHVIADKTSVIDYEVLKVLKVTGYSSSLTEGQEFKPFYKASDFDASDDSREAYFNTTRKVRSLTTRERREGARSSYIGSDVFISLVDGNEAPHNPDLKEIGIEALCSNRDLPLQIPLGIGDSDFTLDINVPVLSVRCMTPPTSPRDPMSLDNSWWRILNHLKVNYLSLFHTGGSQETPVLIDLLKLYSDQSSLIHKKQLEGVLSVQVQEIMRRARKNGPISYTKGLEVEILFNEDAFRGSGVFMLGAVLERFISDYASINSFTETVIKSLERGEIKRWKPRRGMKALI